MVPDRDDLRSAAHWLRTGADYIQELHTRLGIQSTSFADSMRIEADVIDPPTKEEPGA
jgi:hypothetical protein